MGEHHLLIGLWTRCPTESVTNTQDAPLVQGFVFRSVTKL